MAVGFPVKDDYVTGDVLTAANMNDLSGTVNTLQGTQEAAGFAAGKNKIINGDFRFNQRAFTSTTTNQTYGFDRWQYNFTDGTNTYSAQTFTPGAAPVAGYEAINFARIVSTGQTLTSATTIFIQRIEDVRTLANQTATVSFWAKTTTGTPKVSVESIQRFGTGGSPSSNVNTYAGQVTLSTSWTRYSVTVNIPSISGKTLGTNNDSSLQLNLWTSAGSDFNARTNSLGIQSTTIDFWGVQVEASSTASDFQTATGTIQGELAACQRYYYRQGADNLYQTLGTGIGANSTTVNLAVVLPSQMRITPTTIDFSTIGATDVAATNFSATNAVINNQSSKTIAFIGLTFASGITANRVYFGITNNSLSGFLGISAEL